LVPVALEAFNRIMPTLNHHPQEARRCERRRGRPPQIRARAAHHGKDYASTSTSRSNTSARGWPGRARADLQPDEDAATAEISFAGVVDPLAERQADDGRKVTKEMVAWMIPEEMAKIGHCWRRVRPARRCREDLRGPRQQRHVCRVLTLPAYERIDQ
jgi:hypothetical protein